MSTETNYLGLVKPSDNEDLDIRVINGNMDTIDAAIQTSATRANVVCVGGPGRYVDERYGTSWSLSEPAPAGEVLNVILQNVVDTPTLKMLRVSESDIVEYDVTLIQWPDTSWRGSFTVTDEMGYITDASCDLSGILTVTSSETRANIDSEPTSGSRNAVTSGGVWDALGSAYTYRATLTSSDYVTSLTDDGYYDWSSSDMPHGLPDDFGTSDGFATCESLGDSGRRVIRASSIDANGVVTGTWNYSYKTMGSLVFEGEWVCESSVVTTGDGDSSGPIFEATCAAQTTQVTTTGLNLLPPSTDFLAAKDVGYISGDASGEYSISWYADVDHTLDIDLTGTMTLPVGTYYLNARNQSGISGLTIRLLDSDGVLLKSLGLSSRNAYLAFTIEEPMTIAKFGVHFVSSSASSCTIQPTVTRTRTNDFEPYTGGAPSPSPSYPQDLEHVTSTTLDVSRGVSLVSSTSIPMPSREWAGKLPNGVADTVEVDGAGKVTWTLRLAETTTAVTDGVTGTVGEDLMSSTGELADGATVLYELDEPVVEERGYVDLPDIERGNEVGFGNMSDFWNKPTVRYFTDDAVPEHTRDWFDRYEHETGDRAVLTGGSTFVLGMTGHEWSFQPIPVGTRVFVTLEDVVIPGSQSIDGRFSLLHTDPGTGDQDVYGVELTQQADGSYTGTFDVTSSTGTIDSAAFGYDGWSARLTLSEEYPSQHLDTVPTDGSGNAVTSGGTYDAIMQVQGDLDDAEQAIADNASVISTLKDSVLSLGSSKANTSDAIKNITRSGTTFTATRANGTTFTFNQQDNNTTYSAGKNISLSGTSFSLALNRTTMTLTTSGGGNVNTGISCANRVIIAAYSDTSDTHICLPYRGYTASNTWGIHVINDGNNAIVGSTSIAFVIYYLVV